MGSSGSESSQPTGLGQKELSGEMLPFLSFSIGTLQQEAMARWHSDRQTQVTFWELEFLDIPALTAIHVSQAETFLLLCQLATLAQIFPSCCLSETQILDRDRDTHMTINLQGMSYPHRGRNL